MHPIRFVELSPDELRGAVEAACNCTAHFEYWQQVQEPYGAVWWTGGVGVFRLEGHPATTQCYAWSWPVDGSEERRVYTVLHMAPTLSPGAAVRATLADGHLPAECPP